MPVFKFEGRKEREAYNRAVEEEGYDRVISPGGAAALLRVSRQRIWQIVELPEVRCWTYYEGWFNKTLHMADISVKDLVRYGVRTGRIKTVGDIGILWPEAQSMLDEVKSELVE